MSKLRNGLKERGLFLLLFKQLGNGVRTGSGTSGSARDVRFAALRTDCGMQRHRLADNLTVFPSGLCLFTHNMLLLMSPYNGGGLFGGDSGGSFEGNAGIVGAVLIFALLAGLALAFLHNLLRGFGFFRGFRRVEFWCYRHGLGSGNFGTVVQNGIFIALLLGYRDIELYGVDHTLLEGLCVDERNRLCRIRSHYYDNGAAQTAEPIYVNATDPPQPYTMASYLAETAELFRGHEVLRDYARTLGARIVNRTRHSMIDAYERRPVETE